VNDTFGPVKETFFVLAFPRADVSYCATRNGVDLRPFLPPL
jgi:hypothetical protein